MIAQSTKKRRHLSAAGSGGRTQHAGANAGATATPPPLPVHRQCRLPHSVQSHHNQTALLSPNSGCQCRRCCNAQPCPTKGSQAGSSIPVLVGTCSHWIMWEAQPAATVRRQLNVPKAARCSTQHTTAMQHHHQPVHRKPHIVRQCPTSTAGLHLCIATFRLDSESATSHSQAS